jgi:3-dehydroquinate dehydratase type I
VKPQVCVSILPKNMAEAQNLIERAQKNQADLIEVRLDRFEESRMLSDLAKNTKIPLIATNKLKSEQGFFGGSDGERQQTLIGAAKNGFQYVDVDMTSPKFKETMSKLKPLGVKLVVSYHNHESALSSREMQNVFEQQLASGADVCKIVATAKRVEDNLPVLDFVAANKGKAKLVCFCMGKEGKVSRLLSPLFGAFFTFSSLDAGSETAAGQMSIGELRAAYDLLGVT